ncbi:hypothetical protein [Henriciella mobilis]|nr:hypothetical protein [Henriciella mobilis]
MRKHVGWAVGAVALGALGGCTTAELEAISAGLSAGMADAAYTSSQYGYGAQPAYGGRYWSPNTFGSYGGWPANYSYGDWVGYNQCRNTGSFYTCDSNGDGYADMYGNTDDGSYASSSLRVNGRGEAFTWGSDCGCWERNRAYDGPRQPDEIIIYDGD